MFIQRLILSSFRCFGPDPTIVDLSVALTTFVGTNGTGKTAVMQALQRMFGITAEQRRVRRQDFHVPHSEQEPVRRRSFYIEVILAFPELDANAGDDGAVPQFFQQMAADENGQLKCRLRLQADWVDDGSLDGAIETKFWAIRSLGAFAETDCLELKPGDRSRIQLIYVPASRDAASQVASFLRGRLWRAINWSAAVRETFVSAGTTLNSAFSDEAAVSVVATAVTRRWQEVYSAGTDATPRFRPVDLRFQEFIRKVEVVFHPDEAGRDRAVDDLSDGQRSLFHLSMTAAALDIESQIAANPQLDGFQADDIPLPALTLIAVEEPENNLAPFYLSRIVRQIADLTRTTRAQAVLSSHSASILARVDPGDVRYFRLDATHRTAQVRAIRLPPTADEAAKFIREAVQTYPELYFARFVVLGEGASEEIVLPRLAAALDFDIDRSFVAVVPLGGRHVHHLWRLLADLDIPHATLLDLDWGRAGGGWGRIKTACEQLLKTGVAPERLFGQHLSAQGPAANLAAFDTNDAADSARLDEWARYLRTYGVFFCVPLDLDYSMLRAYPTAYQAPETGRRGPALRGDPRTAVLGEDGSPDFYPDADTHLLRWYRYLFLGRGKPSTHARILSDLSPAVIAADAPEELRAFLTAVSARLLTHSAGD